MDTNHRYKYQYNMEYQYGYELQYELDMYIYTEDLSHLVWDHFPPWKI